MVGAARRMFMGIWEAMASRLCWKACCMRRCCSSARRAIFLSGPSPPVSSFSRSCSRVAALAKPATCWWPRASAMEGLVMMEGVIECPGEPCRPLRTPEAPAPRAERCILGGERMWGAVLGEGEKRKRLLL
ncbi:hypothetical protein EYF80_025739 [Liparis tanakae]|uniref:Uncharacterized protein n=1 Tax=Liparis tanakae TaxID=230148 RepID=A0A4Z2HE68_9TELE|nr:hypothetical protein EYF80_025739 [Liparis tanakae]